MKPRVPRWKDSRWNFLSGATVTPAGTLPCSVPLDSTLLLNSVLFPVAGIPHTLSLTPRPSLYLPDQRLSCLIGDENPPSQALIVGPVAPSGAGAADGGVLGVREASGRRKCPEPWPQSLGRWEMLLMDRSRDAMAGRSRLCVHQAWTCPRLPEVEHSLWQPKVGAWVQAHLALRVHAAQRASVPFRIKTESASASPPRGIEDEGPGPAQWQASRQMDFLDRHPWWRLLGLSCPSRPPPPAAGLDTGQAAPAPELHPCRDWPGEGVSSRRATASCRLPPRRS